MANSGKMANSVKFIWLVKYFFNVFAADLNLRKNVFKMDMPPSFLFWRIGIDPSIPTEHTALSFVFVNE